MTMIGTKAFYDRSVANMASLRGQAEQLQQSQSTGRRLNRSSDDPVAASRLRMLSREQTLSNIDVLNADRAKTDLTLADDAMASMSSHVVRAMELATQAASAGLNDAQRASIGQEISQIHGALVSLANGRDSAGHALFGGQSSGAAYTLDASGQARYGGATDNAALELGPGISIKPGITGPEFLTFSHAGSSTDLLSTIQNLANDLSGGALDPASAARDALGSLGAGLDALTTGQTIIGSRLAWIEQTNDMRISQSELHSEEETKIGGTDIATTMTRLQEIMTALQASQAGFSKISGLSLFDALR